MKKYLDALELLPKKIRNKIEIVGPCWIWCGSAGGADNPAMRYGHLRHEGKVVSVHRFIYEKLVGPVSKGKQLDHLCRQRLCCNPLHLEEVSSRTNILRGEAPAAKNARKLLCDRGHPLDREGAYWYKNRNGQRVRVCKICQAKRAHAWYERRGRKLYQQSYQPHPKIPPTHCPKGHPYNKKNTYWHARGNGRQRVCLICKNENYRAWWRRHGRDWQRRRRAAKAGR